MTVKGLDRAAQPVGRASRDTRSQVVRAGERIGKQADDVREIVTAGAEAAADQAETVARQADTAAAHANPRNGRASKPEELPIPRLRPAQRTCRRGRRA